MASWTPSNGTERSQTKLMADINVTPMVDVMLVLLVIFMVTAPLLVAGAAPEPDHFSLQQQDLPGFDEDGAPSESRYQRPCCCRVDVVIVGGASGAPHPGKFGLGGAG